MDALVRVVDVAFIAPENVIGRDAFVEAEIIEQPRRRPLKPHHCHLSRKSAGLNESPRCADGNVNLKGYGEFDAYDRASGWDAQLTFLISPWRLTPPRIEASFMGR
jgi:hypothetical protein